jgi:ribosomal protein S18 acetylase RimI-like enzyme
MTTQVDTTETHAIHTAPAIPGLAFRGFRGEGDYAVIASLIRSCKEADQLDQVFGVEEIANTYAHLSHFDHARDLIFAEVDGTVAGYGRVTWEQEGDGTRLYDVSGAVRPEWRRRGIGGAMLRWQERRLREIAAGHPEDGPRYFQGWASETQVAKAALLTGTGYAPAAYFAEMLRPGLENIPDAPLPEGIEMRPVLPEHYRLIWEADKEACADHWGVTAEEFSDEAYERWLHHPVIFQPALWRIAWDGEEVVGQVKSFIDPDENEEYGRRRGYTEFISVRRPWRRRGIARALLCLSLHAIKERGMEEANLGVHTDNPNGAFRLYESVGFRTVKMHMVYRKPMQAESAPFPRRV